MTVTEQFRLLEKKVDAHLSTILAEKSKSLPKDTSHVYVLASEYKPNVEEWEVEDIRLSEPSGMLIPQRPQANKRADGNKLKQMEAYYEAIKSHEDAFSLTIVCRLGKIRMYLDYDRRFKAKQMAAFSLEELQPRIEKLQREYDEKYAPREGYTPCAYCGKQTPNNKLIRRDIYTHGGIHKTKCFCSNQCADNEQMAHEG